jgi:acetyltransferase-like isoleucine patch superfamily enzyme
MPSNFLSKAELDSVGFKSIGSNVLVSRQAVFFNANQISLGNNTRVDAFSLISAAEPVDIGSYTHVAAGCYIFGSAGCVLADFSWLSPRSAIFTTSDDFSGRSLIGPMIPDEYRVELIDGPVVLEEYSGLGTSSTVLPGVTLHEGAVAGAHSLVTKSCEAWTVYGGVPAKAIKERAKDAKKLGAQCLADAHR